MAEQEQHDLAGDAAPQRRVRAPAAEPRLRAGRRTRLGTPPAAAAQAGRPAALRGHLQLAAENDGLTPWCGPAAVALATGCSYVAACDLLRRTAPDWYPAEGPIVTAYWRDLLAALRDAGMAFAPVPVPEPRPSLLRLVRQGELEAGWYLMRVTDHFLLLHCHGEGRATLHDNRHTGAALGVRTHGRRKLSHMVRLLGAPPQGG